MLHGRRVQPPRLQVHARVLPQPGGRVLNLNCLTHVFIRLGLLGRVQGSASKSRALSWCVIRVPFCREDGGPRHPQPGHQGHGGPAQAQGSHHAGARAPPALHLRLAGLAWALQARPRGQPCGTVLHLVCRKSGRSLLRRRLRRSPAGGLCAVPQLPPLPPCLAPQVGALRERFPDLPIHVHTHDTAGAGCLW